MFRRAAAHGVVLAHKAGNRLVVLLHRLVQQLIVLAEKLSVHIMQNDKAALCAAEKANRVHVGAVGAPRMLLRFQK